MFTGIIATVGKIAKVRHLGDDLRLTFQTGELAMAEVALGDSIAVSGVCLTVIEKGPHCFAADVSRETMRCTSLAVAQVGKRVNLEMALALGSRLGGHLVSGHVEGLGEIKARVEEGRSIRFTLSAPATLLRYIVAKGSICVDGVSLTVNSLTSDGFMLNIVPHTLANTTMDEFQTGRQVNLEVDMLARYVEGLLLRGQGQQGTGEGMQALLERRGFL